MYEHDDINNYFEKEIINKLEIEGEFLLSLSELIELKIFLEDKTINSRKINEKMIDNVSKEEKIMLRKEVIYLKDLLSKIHEVFILFMCI
jgi:hypothetical protein